MEGGPFLSKVVQKEFRRFVEVVLYTDGPEENRKNRQYQRERFGTVALPYYVLLDAGGQRVWWQGGGFYDGNAFEEQLKKAPPVERRAAN
jgi:hypothetical protein